MVIYLGLSLPPASSDLTRERSGPPQCSPIWSCSRWGLQGQPVTWLPVSSYLAFPPLPTRKSAAGNRISNSVCYFGLRPPAADLRYRRYISVALSLGLPPPGVTRHPALRSSDFPQKRPFGTCFRDHPVNFVHILLNYFLPVKLIKPILFIYWFYS